MSASCEWTLIMSGRSRNKYLKEILAGLYEIENADSEAGTKIFDVRDGKNFFTNQAETTIWTDNSKAKRIWGENYLEPQVDVYVAVAKAAPAAVWTIKSSRISESGGSGCESWLEATYEKGALTFKTDTYVDEVTLPWLIESMDSGDDSYESFCECYKVDESIDEDTYEDYKYDDEEDGFWYNPNKNTVSRNHVWDVVTVVVGE